jgi:hypothetical protein
VRPDKIEDLLRREILANQSLDIVIDRVLNNEGPEEALEICKRLANQCPDLNPNSTTALEYSRFMQSTLNEEEFRWLQLDGADTGSKRIRRDRIVMYRRLKKLFDMEIAISRKQKRSCMALSGDWSGVGRYVRESATIARYRLLLSVAGLLFSAGIPGARDLCDAAVFGIFRTVYLSAA